MSNDGENFAAFNSRALVEMVGDVTDEALKATKIKQFLSVLAGRYFNWAGRKSLFTLHLGIKCCAIEMAAAATPRFDGDRFGGSADLDAWLRYARLQSIGIIKTKELFFYRVSELQLSYNDLGLDDSVFIKCCSYHIKKYIIDEAKRSELELCLQWHKLYYRALRYLTSLNPIHLPQFIELHAAISAKVSLIKKVKLASLFLLCQFIFYLPAKMQRALRSPLLKSVRIS